MMPSRIRSSRAGRERFACIVACRLLRLSVPLWMASPALADVADAVFSDGFELPCPGAAPGVTPGEGGSLLLRGTVVTTSVAFIGEVLVTGDTITCVAATCAGQPGADAASIVETKGLIFPGLIDTANHTQFDSFDETDWVPSQLYIYSEWTGDSRYSALVGAKQYLNGESGSPVDYSCELEKYGELKALLAGTTSIVSHATPGNKTCYGSLVRTIDQTPNDLGADYIQVTDLMPGTASADQVCANFSSGSTHAYLVNIAQGTSASARNEFTTLGAVTTVDQCLYAAQTAIVHGTALGDAELTIMAANDMSLVWLPHSDVTLYGQTADVPLAIAKGINVSLGTDSSITGSHNLLAELRYAEQLDNGSWGDLLSPTDLVAMVTTGAAKTLALDATLGSIETGKKADLTVVAGATCTAPWSTLVHARPRDVRLVLVGGVPLYGDASMQAAAPSTPGCEAIDVCGVAKFVCVAESGGTPTNKLGQTLADITGNITQGLADYDALNLTQWDFSPITPLADCH